MCIHWLDKGAVSLSSTTDKKGPDASLLAGQAHRIFETSVATYE
jgi:hypothetical protein